MNVIYCRTAQKSEEDIQKQKDICIDFLKSKGLKADKIFINNGFSGNIDNRPELQNMLLEIENIESITVTSIDRLYRDMNELNTLLTKLKLLGSKLYVAQTGQELTESYEINIVGYFRAGSKEQLN